MPKVGGGPAKGKPAGQGSQVQPAADVDKIKEDVEALATSVGNAVGQQYGHAQDLAKGTLNRSEDLIRRNPLSAILASLGLGFLLGVIRGARK